MTEQPHPQPPTGVEEDPGADTGMFRAFMAGDRPGGPGNGHDGPDTARVDGTSATRFRAVSLLVGLGVFAILVWLLLQA